MTWERARSEEQIEQRIKEIVDATAKLYKNHRIEDITIAMIAKEADFTRSNLYRYFKTKEEIFLELLKCDLADWRKDVLESFSGDGITIDEFLDTWVNLLLKHKRMIALFSIVYTVLEQNASLKSLIAFKQNIMQELNILAAHLTQLLPFKSSEAVFEFLFAQTALLTGICPMLDLTPKQKEAMDTVGMVSSPEYFMEILSNTTASIIKGLSE